MVSIVGLGKASWMNNSQPSHVPFIESFHIILSKKMLKIFQKGCKKIEMSLCNVQGPRQKGGAQEEACLTGACARIYPGHHASGYTPALVP